MFYLNLPLTAFHGGFPEDVTWQGVSVNYLMSPDLPHVQVPETRNPLTEADTVVLQNTIDPLYRNTILVYRQASTGTSKAQSHATDKKRMYAELRTGDFPNTSLM